MDEDVPFFDSLNSHTERLKCAQAVIGMRMLAILNDFYYGADAKGPFGSVVSLADSMRGETGISA